MSAVADGPVWKAGVVPVAELRPAVGVVQIDDDVGGIEQHDQVLREIGERVDAQIRVAQQHGAGLGDGEGSADHREIDIRQILRAPLLPMSRLPAISGTVEHTILAPAIFARTGASRSPERRIEEHPAHAVQAVLEHESSCGGGWSSNRGTSGSGRSRRGRLARMEARMSSRLLIVCLRGSPDASCGRSAWADAAPRGAFPRH